MTYNQNTINYLNSFPRKVANKIIAFEMRHNYSQRQMAQLLHVEFDELVKVEANYPSIQINTYKKYDLIIEKMMN